MKTLIVAKNRDFLLGYVQAQAEVNKMRGIQRLEMNGSEIKEFEEPNPVLGSNFLDITCGECGYYIAFKTANEIPDVSFPCPVCGKIYLIFYTEQQIKNINGKSGLQLENGFAETDSWEYMIRMSSLFTRTLMTAIMLAPKQELERLKTAYPDLVLSFQSDHFKKNMGE
jgi:hypothetical protein